ncbi:sugar phosphate isomerase/epimerase family protein [Novosphingobium sp. KACC 22771]|uniref:sugar phosphate isomerase/epimerase family protein n=1 Tax=Novosphingobium sp. KACC 22771 TaxID=3025670 RepID=UPI0023656C1B|nr:sugar phosphate isomerase/epimerase [Novosphingobium sp. KACC 22771]WDF74376.1 sugar phosphate isomerase/epimerase [Novosphingobium sp. KACC 22771]
MKRVAINPLPWVTGPLGPCVTEQNLREALTDLAQTGFRALHTDVPASMTIGQYKAILDEYGFAPAPGYFAGDFHLAEKQGAIVEQAKAHAGTLAALGVGSTFVAGNIDMARFANPAVGENGSAERTKRIAETLARLADAGFAEGVRFALHPHVAMIIETEEETRAVLDMTAGSSLGFGPDTGHLLWAGMVPERIIADYADRLVAVHLKDVDPAAFRQTLRYEDDYMAAIGTRHLWTEPGRGMVNFDAVFEALPAGFDGWFVVEVDVPNLPSALESSRASYDFLASHPAFAGDMA